MKLQNIFLLFLAILVLALILICYPQIYFFNDKVHYKNFYVYYDKKIPQEIFPILDQVEERLKKSQLYDQTVNFKIFLRSDVSNYNIIMLLDGLYLSSKMYFYIKQILKII